MSDSSLTGLIEDVLNAHDDYGRDKETGDMTCSCRAVVWSAARFAENALTNHRHHVASAIADRLIAETVRRSRDGGAS